MFQEQSQGYSLRIFFPDNTPDGLWVVDESGWNGSALVCPRSLLHEKRNRSEFSRPGVYILTGSKDGIIDRIYIGEGDPILNRLIEHSTKKDFWTKVICFTAKDTSLNKAHIQYLESRLVEIATGLKIVDLDNGNKPQKPTVSEADEADLESFLRHITRMAPVLGVSAFEEPIVTAQNYDLFLSGKGVRATGADTAQGFLVKRGSEAVIEDTPSLLESSKELRRHLIEQGVLKLSGDKLVFQQDYVFKASSPAAEVVLGRSENGRRAWRNSEGISLAELEEKELPTA